MSRSLIGSIWEESECEFAEKEDEGFWFCGDLLLSLFSSESLFSPPSGASPTPRRFPPLARVDGGERRPCFFIGFIFSCSFSSLPNKSFYLFIPEILLGVPLLLCLFVFSLPSFLSIFLLCRGLSLSSCLVFVSRLAHLIPQTQS